VPERAADRAEAIDVQHDRHDRPQAVRAREGELHPAEQERPVGQPRRGIAKLLQERVVGHKEHLSRNRPDHLVA
jgi:hypothetical protein